jgi:hypothetical protein
METVRPAAVSGLFYPADAAILVNTIENDLNKSHQQTNLIPSALFVPHAGYIYSGPTAAMAYQYLLPLHDKVNRVILIGPSHRVGFDGLALSAADWFDTPLGLIKVNQQANDEIRQIPGVMTLEKAHAHEHSVEVQLPFLQYVLDNFEIIPIVAGQASQQLIADVLDALVIDSSSIVVISSDLSHYLEYQSAQKIDRFTSDAILNLDSSMIDSVHACGCVGIRGFLQYAEKHQLTGHLLDLRNSGDTAGTKDKVVGYGAYLFN